MHELMRCTCIVNAVRVLWTLIRALVFDADWIPVSIHSQRQLSQCQLPSSKRHVRVWQHSRQLRTGVGCVARSSCKRECTFNAKFMVTKYPMHVYHWNYTCIHTVIQLLTTLIMSLHHPYAGADTIQWRILKPDSCCRNKHAVGQQLRHWRQFTDSWRP